MAGLRQDVPHDLLPPDMTVNPVNGRPVAAWSAGPVGVVGAPVGGAGLGRLRAGGRPVAAGDRFGVGGGLWLRHPRRPRRPRDYSAWEIVAQVSPAHRDFVRYVWGYGWGTLLSAAQTDAVGGVERLRELPGAVLLQGPQGHLWVSLGDDPATVAPGSVEALRGVLAPVLPTGFQTVEEYLAPRGSLYEYTLPYVF